MRNTRIMNFIIANDLPLVPMEGAWELKRNQERERIQAMAQERGIKSTKGLVKLAKELRRLRKNINE